MSRGIAALPMTKTEARAVVRDIKSGVRNLCKLLTELRDRLGWQALGYSSWAECCTEELGMTKQHANRLIVGTRVGGRVEPVGSTPPPERHARELARLPAEVQAEVYAELVKECSEEGVKVTAKRTREKVDCWLAEHASVKGDDAKAPPPDSDSPPAEPDSTIDEPVDVDVEPDEEPNSPEPPQPDADESEVLLSELRQDVQAAWDRHSSVPVAKVKKHLATVAKEL